MTIPNGDFELGTTPTGNALNWVIEEQVSGFDSASLNGGGIETFESGWGDVVLVLSDDNTSESSITPNGIETFESGWGENTFVVGVQLAAPAFIKEGFESGWGEVVAPLGPTAPVLESAAFGIDNETEETFESQWGSQDALTSLLPGYQQTADPFTVVWGTAVGTVGGIASTITADLVPSPLTLPPNFSAFVHYNPTTFDSDLFLVPQGGGPPAPNPGYFELAQLVTNSEGFILITLVPSATLSGATESPSFQTETVPAAAESFEDTEAASFFFEVQTVTEGEDYWMTVDGIVGVPYTAQSGDTPNDVATEVLTGINSATVPFTVNQVGAAGEVSVTFDEPAADHFASINSTRPSNVVDNTNARKTTSWLGTITL